jgi:metallo-beta-lactamase family protein
VRIHGKDHRVQAQVHTVGGLSAHADQADLLRWLGGFRGRPVVCLVHGETEAKAAFQAKVRDTLGIEAMIPAPGAVLDLSAPGAGLRAAAEAAHVAGRHR